MAFAPALVPHHRGRLPRCIEDAWLNQLIALDSPMKAANEKMTNPLNEKGLTSLLHTCDVATLLGISAKTVHKLVREGKLPCVQVTARDGRCAGRIIWIEPACYHSSVTL